MEMMLKHHNPIEMVFENEEEIHFHGTLCYCILFSLQNSPTQLTVNIYIG